MDANLVRSRENNYLAAVAPRRRRARRVAHVDLSTGEFRVTEMEPAEVAGALEQLGAREVLFPADLPLLAGEDRPARRFVRTELEEWVFSHRLRRPHAARPFQAALARWLRAGQPARGGGRGGRHPALPARHAARRARPPRPAHLLRPRRFHGARRRHRAQPRIGRAAVRRRRRRRRPRPPCWPSSTRPLTGMGGRLLRQRLLRPSMDRAEIEQRLDAVGELLQQTILRAELRKQLGGILDIERLLAKVTLGSAGPRDLLALGRSLEKIPALKRSFDTEQARPPARHSRAPGRAARRGQPDPGGHRRRAAALHRRRRRHPRRLQRRARRAARPQPQRPPVHRADRSARAAAHRHPVAQGALQQRLRLLHRNHARQPAPGARRLRTQADAGQRRALHHARAEGLRAQGAGRRREDPDARKGAVRRACASAWPRRRSASAPPPRAVAELDVDRRAGAGGRREPLPAARVFRQTARCASWPAAIR